MVSIKIALWASLMVCLAMAVIGYQRNETPITNRERVIDWCGKAEPNMTVRDCVCAFNLSNNMRTSFGCTKVSKFDNVDR